MAKLVNYNGFSIRRLGRGEINASPNCPKSRELLKNAGGEGPYKLPRASLTVLHGGIEAMKKLINETWLIYG